MAKIFHINYVILFLNHSSLTKLLHKMHIILDIGLPSQRRTLINSIEEYDRSRIDCKKTLSSSKLQCWSLLIGSLARFQGLKTASDLGKGSEKIIFSSEMNFPETGRRKCRGKRRRDIVIIFFFSAGDLNFINEPKKKKWIRIFLKILFF